MLPLVNFTFSPDKGKQAETLDISDDVIRCIEQTTLLDDVKQKHDLSLQFDRVDTETTYGTQGANSVVVDIHKVVYKGSVAFDPRDEAFNKYVSLVAVETELTDTNITIEIP